MGGTSQQVRMAAAIHEQITFSSAANFDDSAKPTCAPSEREW
jgi:hypothetical protein